MGRLGEIAVNRQTDIRQDLIGVVWLLEPLGKYRHGIGGARVDPDDTDVVANTRQCPALGGCHKPGWELGWDAPPTALLFHYLEYRLAASGTEQCTPI